MAEEKRKYVYINLNTERQVHEPDGSMSPKITDIDRDKAALLEMREPWKRKDGSVVMLDTYKDGEKQLDGNGDPIKHKGRQFMVKLPFDVRCDVSLEDGTKVQADLSRATLYLNELEVRTSLPVHGRPYDPDRKVLRLDPDRAQRVSLYRPVKDAAGEEVRKVTVKPSDLRSAVYDRKSSRDVEQVSFDMEVLDKAQSERNKGGQAYNFQGYVVAVRDWMKGPKDAREPVIIDGEKKSMYSIALPTGVVVEGVLESGEQARVYAGRGLIRVPQTHIKDPETPEGYKENAYLKTISLNKGHDVRDKLTKPFVDSEGRSSDFIDVAPEELKRGIEDSEIERQAWRDAHPRDDQER